MNVLAEFLEAKHDGRIPADTVLILDNDEIHAFAASTGEHVAFTADPWSLLREALDLLCLGYEEA